MKITHFDAAYSDMLGGNAGLSGKGVVSAVDPAVTDDSAHGYTVGEHWVNTATGEEFVLADATAGGAVWVSTTTSPAGAPTTADYLVGTAQAGLSAEIVVGATPGGELGGTWASPTVDATHSGSTHAAAQAAAESTAAGALSSHVGAADPHTGYQKESEKGAASGYAGLGAGGLVPIAQLASGTPDGTKFIRDDGTLVAPGGGGGGSLTVEEVDGTPTDSAVTKLVLPNGTLAIVAHVATYTPAGGGGSTLPLDADALHGTYGDDFTGASLNGRWARHVVTSGEETYQVDGGTGLLVAFSTGAAARSYYQTPGSMFTNGEIILRCHRYAGADMTGPFFLDASGNGVAFSAYNDGNVYFWYVTSWAYASTGTSQASGPAFLYAGFPYWLSLRKSGTTYYARISLNGLDWGPTISGTWTNTMTMIGWGRIYGTPTHNHYVQRFNVVNVS